MRWISIWLASCALGCHPGQGTPDGAAGDAVDAPPVADGADGAGGPGADGGGDGAPGGPDAAPAPAVYVSVDGDDDAPGTFEEPVRTFARAQAIRQPHEELRVFGGVFTERLVVHDGGTAALPLRILAVPGARPVLDGAAGIPVVLDGAFIEIGGFEVRGSESVCVGLDGSDLAARDLVVHDCVSHGVHVTGTRIVVEGCTIHDTVLENEGEQGAWGSALKVRVGGEDVTLRRNRVFHNWGEGIAVTRGVDVRVVENWSSDNYSANYYVDNSYGVTVEGNLCTCVPASGYERAGKAAACFALGEEYYDGWGAQLHDVVVQNNLGAFCNRGVIVFESEVSGGPRDVTIVHNTLWGSADTAVSVADNPVTERVVIENNLVQQADGKTVYVSSPTGIALGHNFWVGGPPEDWRNGAGPGDRSGDPGLHGTPGLTAASFRLGAASAARDGAATRAAPVLDFEGRSRYTGASPGADMGAMEYGDPTAPCAFDALWPQ